MRVNSGDWREDSGGARANSGGSRANAGGRRVGAGRPPSAAGGTPVPEPDLGCIREIGDNVTDPLVNPYEGEPRTGSAASRCIIDLNVCPYVVLNNDIRRRLFRPFIVPRLKSNLFTSRRFKCIFHEVCNSPTPVRALDIDVCPEHFGQSKVIGNNLKNILHSSAVHNSVCDIINEGSPNNFVLVVSESAAIVSRTPAAIRRMPVHVESFDMGAHFVIFSRSW